MLRFIALTLLAACSTVSAADQSECRAVFARQVQCTDQYIPMVVDTRVKLDKPSGIGQYNRDELINAAKEEWREDSAPDAVEKSCAKKKVSAELAAGFKACLRAQSCDAFVACVAPLTEKNL